MPVSLIWKEPGIGSQQKLAQFKRELAGGPDAIVKNRKGIGHSGTLDPFAEGILCVGVGEGTKILSALVGLSKTYVAEMILGATSLTLDSESPLQIAADLTALTQINVPVLENFLRQQVGSFDQVPPQHSAVKIDGKRAFDYARSGVEVEIKPRSVTIHSAQHLSLEERVFEGQALLVWRFEVSVSSGTYIRALARDWGTALTGHPGTLNHLVRTHLGPWKMTSEKPRLDLSLVDFNPLIPKLTLSSEQARGLRFYGRWDAAWVLQDIQKAFEGGFDAPRGYLVVDEASPHVPLALLTPKGEVQRVFVSDPFQA